MLTRVHRGTRQNTGLRMVKLFTVCRVMQIQRWRRKVKLRAFKVNIIWPGQ